MYPGYCLSVVDVDLYKLVLLAGPLCHACRAGVAVVEHELDVAETELVPVAFVIDLGHAPVVPDVQTGKLFLARPREPELCFLEPKLYFALELTVATRRNEDPRLERYFLGRFLRLYRLCWL